MELLCFICLVVVGLLVVYLISKVNALANIQAGPVGGQEDGRKKVDLAGLEAFLKPYLYMARGISVGAKYTILLPLTIYKSIVGEPDPAYRQQKIYILSTVVASVLVGFVTWWLTALVVMRMDRWISGDISEWLKLLGDLGLVFTVAIAVIISIMVPMSLGNLAPRRGRRIR